MKIQIVEDNRSLSDGIVLALKETNLEFIQSEGVKTAINDYENNLPELVILDVNLPDGNGYDYLKWVRERSNIPILMVTANDMEMDEVMGLSLGADDYITKPFSLAVLRARISALMRRSTNNYLTKYNIDEFVFDFERLEFFKNGTIRYLSKNEQKLLKILLENENRILIRSMLVDRIWSDEGEFVDENALSVTVNRLRGKLEDKEDKYSYIQTIYGQGYMWKKSKKGENK